jgi:LuxR family maltose regulon positive regulatory protein
MQRNQWRKAQPLQPPDTSDLLRTKLAPPRLRAALVARDSLLARLDAGLERQLTLLSAPAGFGKTTLVSAWMAARAARHDLPPLAWVSLDAGDNDPVRFWRYLITACQEFDTGIGQTALALLQSPQQIPVERILTAFLNELTQLPGTHMLVLEDYHVISEPQIHEQLAFLLDHLPDTLHVLLMSRSDPPLPLARWRAHNDLSEFDATDLRFSAQETQAFLQQTLQQPLSPEVLARLEARTEGWVAGLHLVALALQGRQTPQEIEQVLLNFSGSHRHILEYLMSEVFNAQPEPVQQFLLQTASLSRLTGSLCNAVTGRTDSQQMLDHLVRANLFLVPLDESGQWYRYHALFAEALQHEARRRLGEATLSEMSRQASRWYEERSLLTEAIEAAFAAQDTRRAAALADQFCALHLLFNEVYTLRRWVEQLPEDLLATHPSLCLNYAAMLLYTLDRSAAETRALVEAPLTLAERFWQAEGNQQRLGGIQAFRAQIHWWQGEHVQAFAATRQALKLLPEDEKYWRGICSLHLGVEELLAGRLIAAQQAVLEARALCQATGQPYGVRAAMHILADIRVLQGQLHQAPALYRQVIAEAGDDLADYSQALSMLAALALEWNDLDAAEQQVQQAIDTANSEAEHIGRHYAEEHILLPALLVKARILHARGATVQAQSTLEELLTLLEQRPWRHIEREARGWQARFALAAGDLAAAQRWYETTAQHTEDASLLQQERESLIVARLLLAQGGPVAALHLLERWQNEPHALERGRSRLEIQVLSVLAHFTRNDQPQARQLLIQALTWARPENYRRLFLDEGAPMAAALRAVLPYIREQALETYVRALLSAFPEEDQPHAAPSLPPLWGAPLPTALIEPLSQQERRVLRLLAAGRSNPEIAQELIVSVNTVKTQVQSIFRKLNVSSRKAARDAAQQMKLL